MERMKMESQNLVCENVEKIGKLFPNCITEMTGVDGKIKKELILICFVKCYRRI